MSHAVSPTDCALCVRLPHKRSLAGGTSAEVIDGLVYVKGLFVQPGRYWDASDLLERCPACGTLYHHEHSVDTEDAFVGGPRTSETHQRILPERGKALLDALDLPDLLAEQVTREPALLARLRDRAEHDPEGLPDTVRPMVIEALTDRFVLDGDWATLERVLLRNPDPRIALGALGDLVHLHFIIARRGPFPDFTDYRDIEPIVQDRARPLLQAHRDAFFACLDAWRADPRPVVRAMIEDVDRSVAYHHFGGDR